MKIIKNKQLKVKEGIPDGKHFIPHVLMTVPMPATLNNTTK